MIVGPVADRMNLRLNTATIAELCRAAGDTVAVGANATAREEEVLLESRLLSHDVLAFKSRHLNNPDQPWSYELSDAQDLEDCYISTRHGAELTKMALARQMQRILGHSDAQRDEEWKLQKDILVALYHAVAPVVGGGVIGAALPAPAARGGARVRGGARGGAAARGGARGAGGAKGAGARGAGRGAKGAGARGAGRGARGAGRARGRGIVYFRQLHIKSFFERGSPDTKHVFVAIIC